MTGSTALCCLGFTALALACSTATKSPETAGPDDSYVAPAPLVGTYWRLVEIASEEGMTTADPELRAHIMLHDERARLGGSGGCNRILGGYEETDDTLVFGRVAATKMACPSAVMQQEQALLDALDATTAYSIKGEVLTLTGGDGDLARFERYLE